MTSESRMSYRTPTPWASAVLLLLISAPPAAAQVTVTLGRTYFGPDSTMRVTVAVPRGGRIARPLVHVIDDGAPLPKRGSRGWVEFPEIAATREIELRAPARLGHYWLIVNDDTRMLARVMFDVLDTMTVLQLERDRLVKEGAVAADPARAATAAAGDADTALLVATGSPRGYLRLAAPGPVPAGARFDVVVMVQYVAPDDAPLQLRWGRTAGLPWEQKESAADSADLPGRTDMPQPRVGANQVSVTAPAGGSAQIELRLFRGSQLLDALTVEVKP